MKKLLTLAITLFLGASLALAQTGGDKTALNPQPLPPEKKATTATKTKKGHTRGRKASKTSAAPKGSSTTTPPPK